MLSTATSAETSPGAASTSHLLGRKAYTCTPCRTRKIKCDRRKVCGQCVRKRLSCIWPVNGVTVEDEESDRDDKSSHNRENKRSKSEYTRSPFASPTYPHQSPASRHRGPTHGRSISEGGYVSKSPVRDPTSLPGLPQTVALAEQLDHSILNETSPPPSRGSEKKDIALAPSTSTRKSSSGIRESNDQGNTGGRQRGPAFPFGQREARGSGGRGHGMATEHLMEGLPQRQEADCMLRVYIEQVEWIHHPLHLPTFLSQYNRFYSLSTEQRCKTVHSRWLALLYIVLCLGAHFGDEVREEWEEELLLGCEDCLSYSDFLNQHSIEAIQTIICLNLYLNNSDRTSAARSFLGLAIKMAVSTGLSRIPDENDQIDKQGVVEREIGRRLWWSLVSQDAFTASTSGFTYLINLKHSSTGFFANVDDEDIGRPSKPMTETTISTYHLAKIEFSFVVRDFIDAINIDFPNASYDKIIELDARFRSVYYALPTALRPDVTQPFDLDSLSRRYVFEQRLFNGITLHNRIMRLHRAYMRKGYSDPKYEYSTKVSVDSALALLDLAQQSRLGLCRWWVVVVHVWTAGLILGADILSGVMSGGERRNRIKGVDLAISLLEHSARISPVAMRGVKVLKALKKEAAAAASRVSSSSTSRTAAISSKATAPVVPRNLLTTPVQPVQFWNFEASQVQPGAAEAAEWAANLFNLPGPSPTNSLENPAGPAPLDALFELTFEDLVGALGGPSESTVHPQPSDGFGEFDFGSWPASWSS